MKPMVVTVLLTDVQAGRLATVAAEKGMSPSELAKALVLKEVGEVYRRRREGLR